VFPGHIHKEVRSKKSTAMFNPSRERIGHTPPLGAQGLRGSETEAYALQIPPSLPRDDRSKVEKMNPGNYR